MGHPINKGERQRLRHFKGMRRLLEDRAEHTDDLSCPCLGQEAGQGKGRVFARFADYPAACSCTMCGNPRRHFSLASVQERKAL